MIIIITTIPIIAITAMMLLLIIMIVIIVVIVIRCWKPDVCGRDVVGAAATASDFHGPDEL